MTEWKRIWAFEQINCIIIIVKKSLINQTWEMGTSRAASPFLAEIVALPILPMFRGGTGLLALTCLIDRGLHLALLF